MPAKPKQVKLKNLAAATKASVQAALGKELIRTLGPGGITAGILLRDTELAATEAKPLDLAKSIAKQVRVESGIKVTPQVTKLPGGILVGYILPRLMKQ